MIWDDFITGFLRIARIKKMYKRKTGILDINGKMIRDGDIIMGDSKVMWDNIRGMWAISNGKCPLGDYSHREDFVLSEDSE